MNEASTYFVAQSVAHARTLPMPQAVLYLRGMLLSCQESAAAEHIRRIYIQLSESDRQLELIGNGQLKLDLSNEQAK